MPNDLIEGYNIHYNKKKSEKRTCDVNIGDNGICGIYHMYGNIYEWCNDKDESSNSYKVALGGSFRTTNLKKFIRVEEEQTLESPTIGFRIFRIINI